MSQRVFSKGSSGFSTLEDVRREVLSGLSVEDQQRIAAELVVDVSLVPGDLKVSCPFSGGLCNSPSKRDPVRRRAWMCGSNFSHDDRRAACVAYLRLDRRLPDGLNARDVRRRR